MALRTIHSFLKSFSKYYDEQEPLSIKALNDNFMDIDYQLEVLSKSVEELQRQLASMGNE